MIYNANATMKMLGNQCYMQIFKDEKKEAFNDMLNAHKAKGELYYIDVAMDAFMLGYIYGKREERKRKHI